jgi:nickel-type superoxide dismutase maturation protease
MARLGFELVEVVGDSMAPTLQPGDLVLAERLTYDRRAPRAGEVVLVADPRHPDRELIKRVAVVGEQGIELRGENPARSTDSRDFGPVPASSVRWRAVARYWPPRRMGRLA